MTGASESDLEHQDVAGSEAIVAGDDVAGRSSPRCCRRGSRRWRRPGDATRMFSAILDVPCGETGTPRCAIVISFRVSEHASRGWRQRRWRGMILPWTRVSREGVYPGLWRNRRLGANPCVGRRRMSIPIRCSNMRDCNLRAARHRESPQGNCTSGVRRGSSRDCAEGNGMPLYSLAKPVDIRANPAIPAKTV